MMLNVEIGECTLSDGAGGAQCLRSPGFPGNYGDDLSCSVRVLSGGTLGTSSFDIEHCDDDYECDGTVFGMNPSSLIFVMVRVGTGDSYN